MPDIFIPEETFDFHEFDTLTPYDIEVYLYNFIEDCYHSGKDTILVITGKGKVVRPTVEKLIPKNKYVRKFKSAGYYNGQQGAFEIYLKD